MNDTAIPTKTCAILIPRFGLVGAAFALLCAAAVHAAGAASLLLLEMRGQGVRHSRTAVLGGDKV